MPEKNNGRRKAQTFPIIALSPIVSGNLRRATANDNLSNIYGAF